MSNSHDDLDELIDDPPREKALNTEDRVINTIKSNAETLMESYKTKTDSDITENYFKLIKLLDEKVDRLNNKLNKLYADEDHNPSTAILLDKISKRLDRKSNKDDVKILDDQVKNLEKTVENLPKANPSTNSSTNNIDMKKVEELITNEITKRFAELQSIVDARLELIDEKVKNVQKSLFSQMQMIH